FLEKANIEIVSEAWLESLLGLLKDRLTYGAEIVKYYHEFFHDELIIKDEVMQELLQFDAKTVIEDFLDKVSTIDFSDTILIEQTIKAVGLSTGIKGKALFMPIRIATTGEAHGPSLPVSLSLLGKEKVVSRIKQTLQTLKGVS